MADVVLGIAASHAPNLANPALMRGVKEEQYERVKIGFAQARTLLEQARPDAIVIFSTDHFDRCFYDNLPPFLVGVGETATGPVNEWLKIPKVTLRVAGDLGRFLVTEGLENGVDFALSEELPLDHAEVVPLSYLTPAWDIPIVPIVVNAFAPPMPSLRRCLQVGAFVGEAVARWPQLKRVAVVGTGGLSHWVGLPETGKVNAAFDRWFLDCLVEGKGAEVATKYKKAEDLEKEAGNGGQEIRDWLAVAAAMPAHLKPRVLAYEPIPGCGIGVMAWAMA
ncbi:MAG: 2,3-dihydroxyphenylpropionate 1,2-dioxygenase [Candidatus Binatia bacterium]|nr:2,3-dihydroxyphenylpropionate 1,2-dioxygenase [Candidatus Binatia bacterium]